ncbi:MAG: DUF7467 domain-containing protein, partial [Planctomycetota bacterium]
MLSGGVYVPGLSPEVEVDNAEVVVDEGVTGATNTGSWTDPDGEFGVPVTFESTITVDDGNGNLTTVPFGTVTKTTDAGFFGYFSWDEGLLDGPGDSHTVTITATDIDGYISNPDNPLSQFQLIVNNIAPGFDAGPDESLNPAQAGQFNRPGIVFTDPGPDVWSGTANYGDGTGDQALSVDQGAMTFDLAHAYTAEGSYTVTVTLQDDDGGSLTDSFVVDVALMLPNGEPAVTVDDPTIVVDEGQTATNGGTFYDGDVGDEVTLAASTGTITQDAGDAGTWSWSLPAEDGPAAQTVTITADDGNGGIATVAFDLIVNNVDPTANADTAVVSEGGAVIIDVLANDTDPAGVNDPLTITGVTGGTTDGATVTFDTAGAYEYLAVGESATADLEYTISDGDGGSAVGTVQVTVTGENDAPTVSADNATVTLQVGHTAENSGSFSDVDLSDNVTVTASVGTVTQDPGNAGTWQWTHDESGGPVQSQVVTVTADDGNGGVATVTFDMFVAGIDIEKYVAAPSSQDAGSPVCMLGKPTGLTFLYGPGDTVATSQDPGKADILYGVSDDDDFAYVLVTDKANALDGGAKLFYAGAVETGDTFTATPENAGVTSFGSSTYIHVFEGQDAALLQSMVYHTSCSQPMYLGDVIGSVTLVGYFAEGAAVSLPAPGDGDADEPLGPIAAEGDTITFTYVVTNPGEFELAGTTVVDDNETPGDASDDYAPAPRLSAERVVVWEGMDGDGDGVFGQRYDTYGAPVGAEFRINATTAGSQKEPAVAVFGDGGFVVVWQGEDGSGKGVFGQRFDGAGDAVGGEFRVNTATEGDQKKPHVVANAAGAFTVVWEGVDGGGKGVFGQRFDAAGNAAGAEFQVNTTTLGDQKEPGAAMAADGGFVVVWEGADVDKKGVFGRRYDAAGNAAGVEFQVNTTSLGEQKKPVVAMAADGSFAVAWEGADAYNKGVFGRRYDAAGNAAGVEFQVNTTTLGDQKEPGAAMAADGGLTVVWESSDADKKGVFGQSYDSAGNPVGGF